MPSHPQILLSAIALLRYKLNEKAIAPSFSNFTKRDGTPASPAQAKLDHLPSIKKSGDHFFALQMKTILTI